MPKQNVAPADRGRPFDPAVWRSGWGQSDPYDGDLGHDPWPAKYSSYGNPVGPTDDRPRFQAAGMTHLIGANQQQGSGRYHDPIVREIESVVITPTSYIFQSGPWPTQPSSWHPGVILPDWMEAE